MNIWTGTPGEHTDLGELPVGGHTDLGTAARLLILVADRLPRGTTVETVHWRSADNPAPGSRLQLTLLERTGDRRAALALSIVDGAGNVVRLADLRCRRGKTRFRDAAGLLREPVTAAMSNERLFPVAADTLTDHVREARPVLSTPDLIAFMEDTAADILRARFSPGAASLGTWIGVRHTGAAHQGETVTVKATVVDVRGRRVRFDVHAWVQSDRDRPVGDGQVEQTMIWGTELP